MSETEPFHSPTVGPLHLDGVLERMTLFRAEQQEAVYRLLIGTDSLPGHNGAAVFVTAVVLQREGNGGIYFWKRQRQTGFITLRQRMYQEALLSLNTARAFVDKLSLQPLLDRTLEIHIDIGQYGPTREMIREIVGMVEAHGFPVRTKPYAIAASSVADRYTVQV